MNLAHLRSGIITQSTSPHDIEKIMQETELQSVILDGNPIATFVIDTDHRVVHWNRACELMTGMSKEILIGRPVDSTAFYPDQQPRPVLADVVLDMDEDLMMHYYRDAGIARSALLAETFEVKSELVMKNGVNTYAHFIATRLRDSSGKVIGAIETLQDITDKILAELKIKKAREAAEFANRAKSEFLANMSHELRTPMNGIIGITELVLDSELNGEQREYLEMVRSSADELLSLINNILDFSKIESGKMELEKIEFELEPLLIKTLKCLNVQAQGKNLRLSSSISDDIPARVTGDPMRLQQLITNLVGNAIKFTKQGEVCLRVVPEHAKRNGGDSDSCRLLFSVSDTGIGIPAEKTGSIFDAFTQVDGSTTRKYGGTGLGLAICNRIVTLMGGKIWVDSNIDKGSTFHFTSLFTVSRQSGRNLPVQLCTSTVSDYRVIVSTKAGEKLNILVAEDNLVNQRLTAGILEKQGHRVTLVNNGKDVLKVLQYMKFSLVLMDLQMPEMDGFEATAIIRGGVYSNIDHNIPIIALTAHAMKEDRDRCLASGMDGYISKPLNAKNLIEIVESFADLEIDLSTSLDSRCMTEPVVDVQGVMERLDGNTGLIKEVWMEFAEDLPIHIDLLRDAVEKKDVKLAKHQAHTLKGAASAVGACMLENEARNMELAIQNNELDMNASILKNIETESEKVLNLLASLVEYN